MHACLADLQPLSDLRQAESIQGKLLDLSGLGPGGFSAYLAAQPMMDQRRSRLRRAAMNVTTSNVRLSKVSSMADSTTVDMVERRRGG
jgi:hypothetical protein